MNLEWDESKRLRNISKHGIDFRDSAAVLAGPVVTMRDDRADYGEARLVTFGLLRGRVVAIAHTESADSIRVISMRKATRREQAQYFESLEDGLEEN